MSTERGVSHALRKKEIIIQRIAPSVKQLRQYGIQIFHCNHPDFLHKSPQWITSTTEEERKRAFEPMPIKEGFCQKPSLVGERPYPD